MNSEQQRMAAHFEELLRANPRDKETHRIYADLLEEAGHDAYAEHHRLWTPEWQDAFEWLTMFAREYASEWTIDPLTDQEVRDEVTIDQVIEATDKWLETGNGVCLSGMGFGITNFMDDANRALFWQHFCAYTRREHVAKMENDDPFICCM